MSAEALDEIQWKSPEFIQERGLHTGNVLEYFSLSPFYDRTSNNQVLMMQFQFQQIQIPMGMTFQQFFQTKLTEMTGIEFIIAYNREPDFWIIRKQKRIDSNNAFPIQDYYIIGANVYQAPKIYDILASRLLSGVLSIKNSMDLLTNMTQYHVSDGGHSYNNAVHASNHSLISSSANLNNLGTGTVSATNTLPLSKSTSLAVPNSVLSALTPNTIGATPQTSAAIGIPNTTNIGTTSVGVSTNASIEITSGAFDNLLHNVLLAHESRENSTTGSDIPSVTINSPNNASTTSTGVNSTTTNGTSMINGTEPEVKSIYLDDIPLYGKGSTVEMLGLKVNINNDDS
ncbi:MED6 mediator subfamily complex component-domain-containing protein [Scheffersomyces amazonensis]|uniref:MED6 mediator subfamily complex component-domain-containing protein n=1 Tax=Scheffersomyces amazonensis TaxID=1078765 RepID=UPI00315D9821